MKVLAVLLVCLAVSTYAAFTESDYAERFESWVQEHGKIYNEDELQYRFRVFCDAMDFVHEHNSGDATFEVELNKFADLTNTEFLERYTGFRQPLIHVSDAPLHEVDETVANPSSVDWRDYGAVTPVKGQGQCGSCWSFSTTGSVEGIHKLKNGTLTSLSEQNLIDCSWSYGNLGCNGGLMDSAFKYIIDNKGIDTESSYPYTATSSRFGGCDYSTRYIGATISGYKDVRSGSESALEDAVAQQPVSVAIDASNMSFQLYKSGVYYESKCSSKNLDHGVLAAGYGTDSGSQYWLVKNSWGTSWGMAGYIEMARNQGNNCGIATQASYPTV